MVKLRQSNDHDHGKVLKGWIREGEKSEKGRETSEGGRGSERGRERGRVAVSTVAYIVCNTTYYRSAMEEEGEEE